MHTVDVARRDEQAPFEERLSSLRRQLAEIVRAERRFPIPPMDRRVSDATPEEVAADRVDYRTPAPPNAWGVETMLGLRVSERLARR